MRPEDQNKRRHPRRIFTTTVQYSVAEPSSHTVVKGVTVNISSSGICLYTFSQHREGQKIKIINGVPINVEEEAVVKWVKKVNNNLYKMGCEFSI